MTHRPRRPGALAVEYALVFPIVFLLILGLVVGGLGVLRYQQVAALARDGARWAAVRGGDYEREQGQPAATPEDVHQQVTLARAVLMGPTGLSTNVTWDDPGKMPTYVDSSGQPHTNRVRVTVTYQWLPEALLGRRTLTSTAETTVAY
jgi:Flp pilus assembly protein TadG